MGYLGGWIRALWGHHMGWWGSLFFAYFVGAGVFSDYDRIRDGVNGFIGVPLMPSVVTIWWVAIPALAWMIATLGHREAMRHWHAARIVFGQPFSVFSPLFINGIAVDHLNAVKVHVHNKPYRTDGGRDVNEAWAEIDLFDLDSRHVVHWLYPRWEENRQPGYANHPRDHFPDTENVRTLAANDRPHILCVALKFVGDDDAHPFRGEDQLAPLWRARDIKIPPGEYLVRIRVHGKGLRAPAEHVLMLVNNGANATFNLVETDKRIQRTW